MNDPVTTLFNVAAKVIGWLLGTLIIGLKKLIIVGTRVTVTPTSQQPKTELDESQRQAACREIVVSYANHLGYIARECISREELEAKIDSGISPDDLSAEIQSRIDMCPGIVLGKQSYAGHEIKLPYYPYRSRHMYLVGRSGSGKTNAIRKMLLQDIANGCGVGVLAPESEHSALRAGF